MQLSMPLRVLSVCSGISAASVAWKPLGMQFVAFCEIDPFACHVLAERCQATAPRHLPEGECRSKYKWIEGGTVPNLGDMTQISDADLEELGQIDIIEGGTPCQGFSIAGLRGGLMDPRAKLTLAFVQLVHRMRRINGLKYVIWENVHGVFSAAGNPFGAFLSGLATLGGNAISPLLPPRTGWTNSGHVASPVGTFAWRVLDAQHWGLAARRKRVFLVGCLGPSGICPLDVLGERGPCEGGVDEGQAARGEDGQIGNSGDARGGVAGGHRAGSAIAYIGGQGDRAASIGASDRIAPTLKAAESGSSRTPFVAQLFDRQAVDRYSQSGVASTLRSNTSAGYDHDLVVHPQVVGTLCASGAGMNRASGQANEGDFCIVQGALATGRRYIVRRLMPVECERLMGFPDGFTDVMYRGKPATDTPRYGAIGNSMAVPCMRFIGEKLLIEHEKAVTATEKGYEVAA